MSTNTAPANSCSNNGKDNNKNIDDESHISNRQHRRRRTKHDRDIHVISPSPSHSLTVIGSATTTTMTSRSSSSFRLFGAKHTILFLLACCFISHQVHVVSSSSSSSQNHNRENEENRPSQQQQQQQQVSTAAVNNNQATNNKKKKIKGHAPGQQNQSIQQQQQQQQQQQHGGDDNNNQNNLLHNLWSKLLHKFDVSVQNTPKTLPHQDPFAEQEVRIKPTRPKSSRNQLANTIKRRNRRRLLYESTLYTHYENYLPPLEEVHEEEDQVEQQQQQQVQSLLPSQPLNVKENIKDATWVGKQLQLYVEQQNNKPNKPQHCVWFNSHGNANKVSFWTYQWCLQSFIQQFHLEPYQVDGKDELGWNMKLVTHIGSYVRSHDTEEEKSKLDPAFKHKILNIFDQQEENNKNLQGYLQFYHQGAKCVNPEDIKNKKSSSQQQHQKKRQAVIRATYGCPSSFFTNENQRLVIYKVDEPVMCEYVLHVCYRYHREEVGDELILTNKGDSGSKEYVLLVDGPKDDAHFSWQERIVINKSKTMKKDSHEDEKSSSSYPLPDKPNQSGPQQQLEDDEDEDKLVDDTEIDDKIIENAQDDDDKDNEEEKESYANLQDIEYVLDTYLYQSGLDAQISVAADRHHHRTTPLHIGLPPLPPSRLQQNKKLIQDMFRHAYDSYMYNAFPASEIKPLSCEGGAFNLVKLPALTLVDALDTLAIMGNYTEFARSVERLRTLHVTMQKKQQEQEQVKSSQKKNEQQQQPLVDPNTGTVNEPEDEGNDDDRDSKDNSVDYEEETTTSTYHDFGGIFAVDQNVSLFETNIRVLGGLLSAHQLAVAFMKKKVSKRDVWDRHGRVLIGEIPSLAFQTMEEGKEAHTHDGDSEENTSHKRTDTADNSCAAKSTQDQALLDNGLGKDGTPSPNSVIDRNIHVVEENDKLHLDEMKKQQACKNSTKGQQQNEFVEYYEYDGVLLELAKDLGHRLLAAFDTKTGIPYGTVNLLYGVPPGETTIASLAGAGTLTLEMELLSRMTGDESFGKAAKLATRALWMRRSPELNLLGKHIDVHTGRWTETLSGIGSNSDSFYEYLIKHYVLFPEDEDFWTMLVAVYNGVHSDTRIGEWYADVDMFVGTKMGREGRRVFESLMAFYPGMQVLLGELSPAARTLNSFFMVREFLGFLPERFNYGNWKVDGSGAGVHPLRPELLESCYFLHRATIGLGLDKKKNKGSDETETSEASQTGWLWAADFALHTLEDLTRAKCGYATVKDLSPTSTGSIPLGAQDPVKLVNEMPSFFLSETLKYLYLAFDDDNVLHTDTEREWVFTTEAHPIHHEPVFVSTEDTDEESRMSDLKRRLKSRLKSRLEDKYDENSISSSDLLEDGVCETEKWAENSPHKSFLDHLTKTKSATADIKEERKLKKKTLGHAKLNLQVLKPLHLGGGTIAGEGWERDNLSHMAFDNQGMGNGYALHKSCINFHNSDLLWVRALNGGDVDYSELYVSVASNQEDPKDSSKSWMMSALMAASSWNSGVYHGADDGQPRCETKKAPVPNNSKQSILAELVETLHPDLGKYYKDSQIQRVNPDNGQNEFDIAGFGNGNGFFVRSVDSGEAIVTTMFGEESNSGKSIDVACVLVELFRPIVTGAANNNNKDASTTISSNSESSKSQNPGVNWRSVFTIPNNKRKSDNDDDDDDDTTPHPIPDMERSLVIADTQGHAFRCEVSIYKRQVPAPPSEENDYGDQSEDDNDEILGTYPCAPSLFGLTRLDNLNEMGGLEFEGILKPLIPGNEYGCKEVLADETTSKDNIVQLVLRGECSFEDKIEKQKHATTVIVINTDDDVFLMSPSMQHTTDDEFSALEQNAGVMIIARDGDDMMEKYNRHIHEQKDYHDDVGDSSSSSMYATVSLVQQHEYVDNSGKLIAGENDEIEWPIVNSKTNLLQIYAPHSWGIQGIGGFFDRKSGKQTDYQLFLLTHNLKP